MRRVMFRMTRSRDDLDRNADLETELAIGAPLINGDFGKSVRIFVPECHAPRQIAEGHRALQNPTRRGKACIEWQHGRPQPGHGIAEMVDVNDRRKVVRRVCPAISVILARPTGWRLAACQHGCDRCEEVAPMKAGREALRLPLDVPTARLSGAALD